MLVNKIKSMRTTCRNMHGPHVASEIQSNEPRQFLAHCMAGNPEISQAVQIILPFLQLTCVTSHSRLYHRSKPNQNLG